MTTHDPTTIIAEADKLVREEPDARSVYLATLKDIAAGEAPADASVKLARAKRQMAESGRIVTEDDTRAHLDIFLKIHERATGLEDAQDKLDSLRAINEIEADIVKLDHVIAKKVDELPEMDAKRELLKQIEPVRRADHAVFQAGQLLQHAKREASELHYKLRPKDVRVDPRRR